ncbi:MAG: single-stranded-DNA-specific exonuclease RecJ [Gammaproteobacteria bacterium]
MYKRISRRTLPEQSTLPDSLHPVLKRVFAARDVKTIDDIDYSLKSLLPFDSLQNIDAAVDLLIDALEKQRRLLIVADFDADGATSCALAIRGLTQMGLQNITYVVPNRFEYGYGLTPEIVDVALEFEPDILLTVDNGISSVDGVNYARQHGMQVMITDHHLPPQALPDADVIINPQLPGDTFPSKNLAGVGVIFYVLLALRARLRKQGWFETNQIEFLNLAQLLDLVALGTVADVVPLDKNNRVLVAHGLKLIRQNKTIPGIRALLSVAGKNAHDITASALGFFIAPRLNAAGRLTDMSLGIECLLSDDEQLAMNMAKELDTLNSERRQIQDEMQAQALLDLEQLLPAEEEHNQYGLCIYNPDWHQGVIGILAAKIKDHFNCPVIAFARERKGLIKGSARSIQGLHIRDLLESITLDDPDLILTFGGHAMAAGLTLEESMFERFQARFESKLVEWLSEATIENLCLSDGELSAEELSMQLANAIQEAGPWGQAFPEPVFDGTFRLVDRRIVGGNHLKLRLQTRDNNKMIDAISFNTSDETWPGEVECVQAAYRLDINEYQNRRTLQLLIEHIEPV